MLRRAEPFNEGAAQVRRLLDRDRKELNYDELEASFASKAETPANAAAADAAQQPIASSSSDGGRSGATSSSAPPPPRAASPFAASSAATPVSPFGSSSGIGSSGISPFGPSAGAAAPSRKPFAEPAGLDPRMQPAEIKSEPWWSKVTLTQVVIILSFAFSIGLMLATFEFVLHVGAIRLNTE